MIMLIFNRRTNLQNAEFCFNKLRLMTFKHRVIQITLFWNFPVLLHSSEKMFSDQQTYFDGQSLDFHQTFRFKLVGFFIL